MARSQEFNREMDMYLRQRKVIQRTNPLLSARNYFRQMFVSKPKKQEQEMPLDIPPEQVQAVLQQAAVKPVPRTTVRQPVRQSTAQPSAPQTKPKVKSMGWFGKKKEDDYETIETAPAQPVLDEEVKEVLKITFKWLKQMDPEQIEEIKASPDFEKYKRVLDKYGLIKK